MGADAPRRTRRQPGSRSRPPSPGADPAAAVSDLVRITDVRPLERHWARLLFSNGVVKDVDLGEALAGGGVFDQIYRRRDVFEQVRVNPESRTIEWPGDVDLDPDVLYGASEADAAAFASNALCRHRAGDPPTLTARAERGDPPVSWFAH